MKNYEVTAENWKTTLDDLTTKVKSELEGRTIMHKTAGEGKIMVAEIVFKDNIGYLKAMVEFKNGHSAQYNLNLAYKTNAITGVNDFITDVAPVIDDIAEMRYKSIRADRMNHYLEQQKAEEERRQAEKQANEAEKYQAHMDKVLAELNMAYNNKSKAYRGNFYHTLGWLAGNACTISATIPDYVQGWFEKTFGPDAPKSVVDSKRKTSGGYSMKWNPSFKLYIKKAKTTMPIELADMTDGKNTINNTGFIFDLVSNYGFSFGKKQNVDNIIKEIPADKLQEFMAGYNGGK